MREGRLYNTFLIVLLALLRNTADACSTVQNQHETYNLNYRVD